jgi:hypothetical protein
MGDKQRRRLLAREQHRSRLIQVATNRRLGTLAQRHDPGLFAFADCAQIAGTDVQERQLAQLADPQPGRVQHFNHRRIASPARSGDIGPGQQPFNLGLSQNVRQRSSGLRQR